MLGFDNKRKCLCCMSLNAVDDEWHCGGWVCAERWTNWKIAFAKVHDLRMAQEKTRALVTQFADDIGPLFSGSLFGDL